MAMIWAGQSLVAPFGDQRRHGAHARRNVAGAKPAVSGRRSGLRRDACRLWYGCEPFSERLRSVKREHRSRSRLRIETIGETRFGAGRLYQEGQRTRPRRQAIGQAPRVLGGLHLDASERDARLLGLDDAGSLAVDVEQVVGEAVARLEETRGSRRRGRRGCWPGRRSARPSRPGTTAYRSSAERLALITLASPAPMLTKNPRVQSAAYEGEPRT